jgi:hypothetical protein
MIQILESNQLITTLEAMRYLISHNGWLILSVGLVTTTFSQKI